MISLREVIMEAAKTKKSEQDWLHHALNRGDPVADDNIYGREGNGWHRMSINTGANIRELEPQFRKRGYVKTATNRSADTTSHHYHHPKGHRIHYIQKGDTPEGEYGAADDEVHYSHAGDWPRKK
jgi:hypothetical protein